MSLPLLPTIIISIIVLILIVVIFNSVSSYLKGSIKLTLDKNKYEPGDDITGIIHLITKKPIEGNEITLTITGNRITESYDDGKLKKHSRQIYGNKIVVHGAENYLSGHTKDYTFSIPPPNSNKLDFMSSDIGSAINIAASLLTEKRSYIKWYVEARLDAKGADLTKKLKLNLNIGDSF